MSITESNAAEMGARDIVLRELQGKERLVWVGRATKCRLEPSAFAFLGFGVMFLGACAIVAFKGSSIIGSGKGLRSGGFIFLIFLIPFALAGLRMLLLPWIALWKTRKNVYAITDQRAIVLSGSVFGSASEVRSFRREQLGNLRRSQRSDGSGDLVFEDQLNVPGFGNMGTGWKNRAGGDGTNRFLRPVGFLGVESVREVEMTLRDALRLNELDKTEVEPSSSV